MSTGPSSPAASEQTPAEPSLLVVEYQKAQDSAQHHDTLAWSSIAVFLAANVALLSLVLKDLQRCSEFRLAFSVLAALGMALSLVAWRNWFLFNGIKRQKYDRCKALEAGFGFRQHSSLKYPAGSQHWLVSTIIILFCLIWVALIVYVNRRCPFT